MERIRCITSIDASPLPASSSALARSPCSPISLSEKRPGPCLFRCRTNVVQAPGSLQGLEQPLLVPPYETCRLTWGEVEEEEAHQMRLRRTGSGSLSPFPVLFCTSLPPSAQPSSSFVFISFRPLFSLTRSHGSFRRKFVPVFCRIQHCSLSHRIIASRIVSRSFPFTYHHACRTS
jgi:hypothetical protein